MKDVLSFGRAGYIICKTKGILHCKLYNKGRQKNLKLLIECVIQQMLLCSFFPTYISMAMLMFIYCLGSLCYSYFVQQKIIQVFCSNFILGKNLWWTAISLEMHWNYIGKCCSCSCVKALCCCAHLNAEILSGHVCLYNGVVLELHLKCKCN